VQMRPNTVFSDNLLLCKMLLQFSRYSGPSAWGSYWVVGPLTGRPLAASALRAKALAVQSLVNQNHPGVATHAAGELDTDHDLADYAGDGRQPRSNPR
jgi:hypothetical protein